MNKSFWFSNLFSSNSRSMVKEGLLKVVRTVLAWWLSPSLDIVLSPHRTQIFRFGAVKARWMLDVLSLNHTNAFLKTHRFHLMKTEQKICIHTSVFVSFSLRFHPSTLMRFWKWSSKRQQDTFVTSAQTMVTFVLCWTARVLVTRLIIRHFVTKFRDSRLVFYTWKRCSLPW